MPAVDVRTVTLRDRRTGRTYTVPRTEMVRAGMAAKLANHARYLIENIHRTDKGRPVDMTRNPQWEAIAFDPSPDVVVVSAAQTGKSLMMMIRMIAGMDLGLECLLIVPKDDKRTEFVRSRWEDTVKNTPYYRQRMKDARGSDSVTLKHFGAGKLHIKTAAADDDLIAFSCDAAFPDEYDFCNKTNLSKYPKRMNASEFRLTHESSTPTLPGSEDLPQIPAPDNIMSRFYRGSQNLYHSTCEFCGHRQVLDFYENVVKCQKDDQGRIFTYDVWDQDWSLGATRDLRACCSNPKCRRPIDRARPGLWIPTKPGRRITSYWVNRLNSLMGEPLAAFIPKFAEAINNPSKMMEFNNMDLGYPYSGGVAGFTRELITSCAGSHDMLASSSGPCSAGIDCNVPYYDVHISRWTQRKDGKPLQVKLHAAKVQGKEALYGLLRRFNVRVAVMDQQPEVNESERMQAEFGEKCNGAVLIRACYSPHELKDHAIVAIPGENRDLDCPRLIKLSRTQVIDGLLASMLNGEVQWFRNFAPALNGRHLHEMTRMVRKIVPTPDGEGRFAWEGEPAHQCHAAVLDRMVNDPICKANLISMDNSLVLIDVDNKTKKGQPELDNEVPLWLAEMRG